MDVRRKTTNVTLELRNLLFAVVVAVVSMVMTIVFTIYGNATTSAIFGVCTGTWLSLSAMRFARWQNQRDIQNHDKHLLEIEDGWPD